MTQRIWVSLAVAGLAALAIAAASSQVSAGLRVPQVPVQGGTLQAYLNSQGETINVLTDQQDTQAWTLWASGTLLTVKLTNAGGNDLGLYDAGGLLYSAARYYIFPDFATAGYHAVLSFPTAPVRMVMSLFRANGEFLGDTTVPGVDANNLGFYIGNFLRGTPHLYSQDYRNTGSTIEPGKTQVLAFQGTGANGGKWYLCFEDTPIYCCWNGDGDYDDAIILMESVQPLATKALSLGAVKALYR